MPRYNVEYNGKWACFSSVVDNFITPFMSREDYENWRKSEYGKQCVPIEQTNLMMYEEATEIIERANISIEESEENNHA